MTTLKMRVDSADDNHIHVTLFAGEEGYTLENIGHLCMSVGQYQIIFAALGIGADAVNRDYPRLKFVSDEAEFFKAFQPRKEASP